MRMIATRPASFFVNFARFPMNHYSRLPLVNFCNVSGFSSRCSSKCCILKHIFPLQEEPQQHTQTFVSVRENLLVLTSCDKRTRNPTQAATSSPITWIDSVGWIGSFLDAGWGTGLTFKIVGIGDGPDLDITWILKIYKFKITTLSVFYIHLGWQMTFVLVNGRFIHQVCVKINPTEQFPNTRRVLNFRSRYVHLFLIIYWKLGRFVMEIANMLP